MIKSVFAAVAATPFLASAAVAGPYVNVETNAGWVGDDYHIHVGYESGLGESAAWYVQGGPALVSVDGEETETEISGKAGLGVDVTESVNVYGEISFLTADNSFDEDLGVGAKAGVKWSF